MAILAHVKPARAVRMLRVCLEKEEKYKVLPQPLFAYFISVFKFPKANLDLWQYKLRVEDAALFSLRALCAGTDRFKGVVFRDTLAF